MDHSEMNSRLLSDQDAIDLMAGRAPQGRPDLEALAEAIADFRDAFTEPAPQPSPELVGRLTGVPVLPRHETDTRATAVAPLRPHTSPLARWIRTAVRALAGLGIAAKVGLGGTAALAVVTAAGMTGVLPEGPQAVFDRIFDKQQTDQPSPGSPSEETSESETPTGSGAEEAGKPPSPAPITSRPGDRGGDGKSPNMTGEQSPSGGGQPAPQPKRPGNPGNPGSNPSHEGPENEPDDEAEPDGDAGFEDEPRYQPDDEDDLGHPDETEENEDSSDRVDADRSSDSSTDTGDIDTGTQ